jgi:alpha-1,3-rhamnosyl/mannosyltransferase
MKLKMLEQNDYTGGTLESGLDLRTTGLQIALDARYVQSGFPGIGRYVYSLANAMAEQLSHEEPTAKLNLLYNPAKSEQWHDLPALAEKYPQIVRLHTTEVAPISVAEQWRLFGLARAGNFKVWHAPYYIRPYLLPVPSVLTAYDVTSARLPALLPSKKARLVFSITTRLAFLTSRKLIAISQASKKDIVELYRVRPEKIEVVPLGFAPHFRPVTLDIQAILRAELGLPNTYALYVGINKPHKNLMCLLDAFQQFKARTNSPLVLLIAGKEDPRYTAALHQHARELGLLESGGVRFWGEVGEDDLPKLYAAAEFLIMPSLYEGFGLPVLEALASGCPVAAADNSSLPEVVGSAGLLFEATDTTAMSRAIERLATEPALRAELREKGLHQASLFSWERAANATLTIYRHVQRH